MTSNVGARRAETRRPLTHELEESDSLDFPAARFSFAVQNLAGPKLPQYSNAMEIAGHFFATFIASAAAECCDWPKERGGEFLGDLCKHLCVLGV